MTATRSLSFKLYPSPAQAALARKHLMLKDLWNAALEERIGAWRHSQTRVSRSDQEKALKEIRFGLEGWRGLVHTHETQVALKRLDLAFQAFFRRLRAGETPGFPRFKSAERFRGWGYKEHGNGFRVEMRDGGRHGHATLFGIGRMRMRMRGVARRKDFLHKTSARIAGRHRLIATEALAVRNMIASAQGTAEAQGRNLAQKEGLNRSILDTAPAGFLNMLRYKAEEAGAELLEAKTRELKPSQRCPDCGAVRKWTLAERYHDCDCGCRLGRDEAAARVLLSWGLVESQRRQNAETINPAGAVGDQAAAWSETPSNLRDWWASFMLLLCAK